MLEVHPDKAALVSSLFNQAGVPCSIIGSVVPEQKVDIRVAGEAALSGNTAALRWVICLNPLAAGLDVCRVLLLTQGCSAVLLRQLQGHCAACCSTGCFQAAH